MWPDETLSCSNNDHMATIYRDGAHCEAGKPGLKAAPGHVFKPANFLIDIAADRSDAHRHPLGLGHAYHDVAAGGDCEGGYVGKKLFPVLVFRSIRVALVVNRPALTCAVAH
jgi:hypothetical protein